MKQIRLINVQVSQDVIDELLEQNAHLSDEDKNKVAEEAKKNGLFKYKSALLSVLRTPMDPRGGISIEEMEKTLPIITQVKKVEENGILELDDADWSYIEQKLMVVRTTGFDERWVGLKSTIKNATKNVLDETVEEKNGSVRELAFSEK